MRRDDALDLAWVCALIAAGLGSIVVELTLGVVGVLRLVEASAA